jgi:hypothetical protein
MDRYLGAVAHAQYAPRIVPFPARPAATKGAPSLRRWKWPRASGYRPAEPRRRANIVLNTHSMRSRNDPPPSLFCILPGCSSVSSWTRSCVWRVRCRLSHLGLWGMRARRVGARFARSERVPCHFQANAPLRRILSVEPAGDGVRPALRPSRPES